MKSNLNDNYAILVNKNYKLPDNYEPSDLILINEKYSIKGMARKKAKEAFEKLCEDALKENLKIINESSYRSYKRQLELYNEEISKKGLKANDSIAIPGHSEHQTGLAFDLCTDKENMYNFIKTEEFKWINKNGHKYGFILRYPRNKEHITGYIYEPWHYRYLGVELATKGYESKLTYDEYYFKYIKKDSLS